MKEIIIPLQETADLAGLHSQLAEELGFPEHYGRNFDALYDCLTGDIELPVKVIFEGVDDARKRLGPDLDKFFMIFNEASIDTDGSLTFEKQ